MIVDVFMFDDEFDMLECRLYELRGIVDLFVAVEADHTFTGIPKPYHLSSELKRFPDAPIQVIQAATGDVGDIDDAYLEISAPWCYQKTHEYWRREVKQRDAAEPLLRDLPKDTLVLIGDLDEIPRRSVVKDFSGPPAIMRMAHLVYSTAWLHPQAWFGTGIGTIGEFGTRPSVVRARRGTDYRLLFHAGWHMSWFGSPERRVAKLAHSAHQEWDFVGEQIGTDYPAAGKHLNGTPLIKRDGDAPAWVMDGYAPLSWTPAPEEGS